MKCGDAFFGSVTVGERGQVVIPAEARAELGIQAGDKLIVMRHPVNKGLMMFKFDAMREFLDEMEQAFQAAAEKMEEAR
jgi:AbrB family looped-hinge helix DNA binding protein